MDGFKKHLSDSIQLTAFRNAVAGHPDRGGRWPVFSPSSPRFDEAHEMQDETLRQVAVLFERQQMTLRTRGNEQIVGDDEESRVIVQYLTDSSKATRQ